jgi:hypothetical protein
MGFEMGCKWMILYQTNIRVYLRPFVATIERRFWAIQADGEEADQYIQMPAVSYA